MLYFVIKPRQRYNSHQIHHTIHTVTIVVILFHKHKTILHVIFSKFKGTNFVVYIYGSKNKIETTFKVDKKRGICAFEQYRLFFYKLLFIEEG